MRRMRSGRPLTESISPVRSSERSWSALMPLLSAGGFIWPTATPAAKPSASADPASSETFVRVKCIAPPWLWPIR